MPNTDSTRAAAPSAAPPGTPVESLAARITAGAAGLLALAIVSVLTVGLALVAAIGVAGAGVVVRRRGKQFTRTAAWIGAVAGAGLAIIALTGFGASVMPEGTWDELRHVSDSARANSKPPAWLERVSPGTAAKMQKQAQQRPSAVSGAVNVWAGVTGLLIGLGFIATAVGTLGWAVSLPLAFAFSGRWIP